MDLEKYGTAGDIRELLAVRDRLDDLIETTSADTGTNALLPRIDAFDLGDAFQVVVEVPGVTQENLEIAVHGTELTVAGLREPMGDDDPPAIVLSERPAGPFQRSIDLPEDVRRDGATAHLQNGLLIVHLPKA